MQNILLKIYFLVYVFYNLFNKNNPVASKGFGVFFCNEQ